MRTCDPQSLSSSLLSIISYYIIELTFLKSSLPTKVAKVVLKVPKHIVGKFLWLLALALASCVVCSQLLVLIYLAQCLMSNEADARVGIS